MYQLIVGTQEEIDEILKIAKEPLESTVKFVSLIDLVNKRLKLPHKVTSEHQAMEYLGREIGEDFKLSFYGVYDSIHTYADAVSHWIYLKHVEGLNIPEDPPLPIVVHNGQFCVPILLNLERFGIIRGLKDRLPLQGTFVGEHKTVQLPRDGSALPLEALFDLAKTPELDPLHMNIEWKYTLTHGRTSSLRIAAYTEGTLALLMSSRSYGSDKVLPYQRDVDL